MIPASFDYEVADSPAHAISLLAEHGEDAKLLAGGHSLLPMMKVRLAQPAVLIDIARVTELSGIRLEGDEVVIGATTRHADVAGSSLLQAEAPILAYAAAQVGDPQIRHRGTIGGLARARGPVRRPADDAARARRLGRDHRAVGRARGRRRRLLRRAVRVRAASPTSCSPRSGCRAAARSAGGTRSSSGGPTTGRSSASPSTTAGSRSPPWAEPRCGPRRPSRRCRSGASIEEAAALAADGTSPGYDFHADADYRAHLARVLTRRALEGKTG